ncbi:MAG: 6-bladed beta-propeller [Tannerella sp.]|jgi:hypothetical protein|nr:6-bladed beta-propeller [Tannerella sp.]
MKRLFFIFLIIPILFCQCNANSSNHSDEKNKLSIESFENKKIGEESGEIEEIPIYTTDAPVNNNLSEIASNIDFVWLDFDPPLNDFHISSVELSEDNIFLASAGDIKSYDMDGKFIQHIGRSGMGPQEYINISFPLQLDRSKQLIYASDLNRQRVVVYRYNGTFVQSFQLINGALAIIDSSMIALRQSLYDRQLKPAPLIKFITHDGKVLKTIWSKNYPISQMTRLLGPDMSPLWSFKNRFYYLEYGTDTIFNIMSNSLLPARILTGELKLSLNEHYLEKTGNKLRLSTPIQRFNAGIFESNRIMIFRLSNDYERFFIVYNKDIQSLHRTRHENPLQSPRGDVKWHDFFVDDMISGLNFNPQYQSMDKAIALIPAAEICKKRQEILDFIAKHPSDQSTSLKQIVENFTEDHNSLMMMVTFK